MSTTPSGTPSGTPSTTEGDGNQPTTPVSPEATVMQAGTSPQAPSQSDGAKSDGAKSDGATGTTSTDGDQPKADGDKPDAKPTTRKNGGNGGKKGNGKSTTRTAADKLADADKKTRQGVSSKEAAFAKAAESGGGAKPKSSTPKVKAEPKFPAEISSAVKRARYELSGLNPKIVAKREKDPNAHVPGASAGEHTRVRGVVAEMLPGDKLTQAGIVGLTGLKTFKNLVAVASWDSSVDMSPLAKSDLAAAVKATKPDDAWQRGRYLAAILVVYAQDVVEAAKVAKKAASKPAKGTTPKDGEKDQAAA